MSVWHAKPTAGVQLCCRRIQNSQVLAQSCLVSSCGHTAAVPPAPSWNHCKKQQAWASATERRRLTGNKWKQCGVSLVQGKPFTSLAPPQIINYCNWYILILYLSLLSPHAHEHLRRASSSKKPSSAWHLPRSRLVCTEASVWPTWSHTIWSQSKPGKQILQIFTLFAQGCQPLAARSSSHRMHL